MIETIKTMIADILRVPVAEINEHTSMESHSMWDSLSHMEIVYALEKKFGIAFEGDEILEITSVSKIIAILSQKQGVCLEA